jgi:signal transduction histidine kinase
MPPCRISVDRIYFTRVLENLLRNAVQSMEGVVGRAKQVHISAKTENERAYISIRDTGIGMPPEIISRIFDPYFTTRSQGTGLGLHICRQFVQDMKGEISLESTVNQGTTFTISFPIVAAEPDFPFS